MLAVLLPVILTQGASLRRELDAVRADVGEVRRDLHDVSDRVARIEGALTGRGGAVPGAAGAPALPGRCRIAAGARLQVGSDGALLGCDGRRVVGDHP